MDWDQAQQKGRNILSRRWHYPWWRRALRLFRRLRFTPPTEGLLIYEAGFSVYDPAAVEVENFGHGYFMAIHKPCPLDPETCLPATEEMSVLRYFGRFRWLFIALGPSFGDNDLLKPRLHRAVKSWIRRFGARRELNDTELVAERLWALLSVYYPMMEHSSGYITKIWNQYIVEQINILLARQYSCEAVVALKVGRALLGASLLMDRFSLKTASVLNFIHRHAEFQLLADGAHYMRSPFHHFEVFWCLLDCQKLLEKKGRPPPVFFQSLLDKMGVFLRLMRYTDGSLGLFQGGYCPSAAFIKNLLRLADCEESHSGQISSYAGYLRVHTPRYLLLFDVGGLPSIRNGFFPQAHCLSFELCYGRQRVVVNAGGNPDLPLLWQHTLSQTEAHSAPYINDETLMPPNRKNIPQRRFFRTEGRLRRRYESQTAQGGAQNLSVSGSHGGFGGITLERVMDVGDSSPGVEGRDTVRISRKKDKKRPRGETVLQIPFHLHPFVVAHLEGPRDGEGAQVVLNLEDGGRLFFSASAGEISLLESRHIGSSGWPQKSQKIVLSLPVSGQQTVVKWRFCHMERAAAPSRAPSLKDTEGPLDS